MHNICAYAINVGAGSNVLLGCRAVPVYIDPFGSLEATRQNPTGITINGWALDPDSTSPIRVDVYADGIGLGSTTAGVTRPDIDAAYHDGAQHGFTASFALGQGSAQRLRLRHQRRPRLNTLIFCKTINLDFSPVGYYDAAMRTTDTSITVSGWAADQNTTSPLTVQITLDGAAAGTATTGTARPDVAAAVGAYAANSGFSATLSTTDGEHIICLTAVNVGMGNDTSLGCKTVIAVHPTVASAPQNVSAAAGFGAATVNWTAPATDGGAPISYVITSSPGGVTATAPLGSTNAIVYNLAAHTTYSFSVVAVNVVGSSSAGDHQRDHHPGRSPAPDDRRADLDQPLHPQHLRRLERHDHDVQRGRGRRPGQCLRARLHAAARHRRPDPVARRSAPVGHRPLRQLRNLVAAVDAYVDGYASTQQVSAPAMIALGTNNDVDVSGATGADWANLVVNPVRAHSVELHRASRSPGADDMEPGFSATASQTGSWLTGYLGATSAPFVFNGSADGCNPSAINGTCNNGWTEGDLYWLSGGRGAEPGHQPAADLQPDDAQAMEIHLAHRGRGRLPAHQLRRDAHRGDRVPASRFVQQSRRGIGVERALGPAELRRPARAGNVAVRDRPADQLMPARVVCR